MVGIAQRPSEDVRYGTEDSRGRIVEIAHRIAVDCDDDTGRRLWWRCHIEEHKLDCEDGTTD